MEALGRLFDVSVGCVPTDAVAGAITGKRVSLAGAGGVTIVVVTTGTSTDITDVDLQQHTAASGGSPADLDIIDHYYYKSASALDGTQTWMRATQTAASEITDVGAASQQLLLVIEVEAEQLSDGYSYVSLDIPDLGTNGTRHCSILYFLRDLKVMRKAANMPAPLR
ncbi:hypothetical protein ACFWA4_05940 [Streptomyces sp. NPDC060011]|uniref:hypothetical protein n=1 Tax=Streptomyces sp. NPDC060011 TaxID=3347037 RepID=UPI0036A4B378